MLYEPFKRELSAGKGMGEMNQYDQFSLDYHWLLSDNVLSGKPFI
jgi:hypothetical protein